ncbi:nucleotidyltransferase family protein [Anaerobaca lacustris]|uniref:Nucleotidyltransferase domain-containing protein n=1 Tax=Anaerobaca lacustris TaxID=3044600 RepID=A0AAW6U313_9BACT|nr:nucleotidyltransferase domain-containing protein [Sedimentisphaerales bacterium M17dextr]
MGGLFEDRREELTQLCRDFCVKRLDVFGSAARHERFDPNRSDIDLLVEFEPMEPVDHAKAYFGLLAALQDLYGRPIDLLEIRAVTNPYLLESITKQRRQIYAA